MLSFTFLFEKDCRKSSPTDGKKLVVCGLGFQTSCRPDFGTKMSLEKRDELLVGCCFGFAHHHSFRIEDKLIVLHLFLSSPSQNSPSIFVALVSSVSYEINSRYPPGVYLCLHFQLIYSCKPLPYVSFVM